MHRSNNSDRDVILLVMVNDNREALLHQRWATYASTGKPTPRVVTTSYRKLRAWPTEPIWWPIGPRVDAFPGTPAQARRLHQVARQGPPIQPANAGHGATGGTAERHRIGAATTPPTNDQPTMATHRRDAHPRHRPARHRR